MADINFDKLAEEIINGGKNDGYSEKMSASCSIDEQIQLQLVDYALKARENAYVPYSDFKVGAAILTEKGTVYTGCNIENASYGLTNCAERTAIFKAVSEGHFHFVALAVVADSKDFCAPCGACRQVMVEFNIPWIIMANAKGDKKTVALAELMPYTFTKQDMK